MHTNFRETRVALRYIDFCYVSAELTLKHFAITERSRCNSKRDENNGLNLFRRSHTFFPSMYQLKLSCPLFVPFVLSIGLCIVSVHHFFPSTPNTVAPFFIYAADRWAPCVILFKTKYQYSSFLAWDRGNFLLIHLTVWKFSIHSYFYRLSQNGGWAGLEHYGKCTLPSFLVVSVYQTKFNRLYCNRTL